MFTVITNHRAYRVSSVFLVPFRAEFAARGIEILAVEQDNPHGRENKEEK